MSEASSSIWSEKLGESSTSSCDEDPLVAVPSGQQVKKRKHPDPPTLKPVKAVRKNDKARAWSITLNGAKKAKYINSFKNNLSLLIDDTTLVHAIGQIEHGELKTNPHIQLAIMFKNPRSWTSVKAMLETRWRNCGGVYLEVARNYKNVCLYVTAADKRHDAYPDYFEYGVRMNAVARVMALRDKSSTVSCEATPSADKDDEAMVNLVDVCMKAVEPARAFHSWVYKHGMKYMTSKAHVLAHVREAKWIARVDRLKEKAKQIEWRPWQARLLAELADTPNDRHVYWMYDKEGNTGKTFMCQHYMQLHPLDTVLLNNGKQADMAFILHKKDKVKTIFVDLSRGTQSRVNYAAFEQFKNGTIQSGKYESNVSVIDVPHMVFFANFLPEVGEMSADRWIIWEIDDDCHASDVTEVYNSDDQWRTSSIRVKGQSGNNEEEQIMMANRPTNVCVSEDEEELQELSD